LFHNYLFPSAEEGDDKDSSPYQCLHLPIEQYDPYFYEFVDTLDPLLVLRLPKQDFIQNTKVKMKNDINILNHTPMDGGDPIIGISKYWRTEAAYILAVDLQSVGRSGSKSCYWTEDVSSSPPIIIDTGASVSVSPNAADFYGPIMLILGGKKIEGLNSQVRVEGSGRVRWTAHDNNGREGTIGTQAYFIPSASIHLMSPQTYFQESE
jgi:hypothetical protein